MILSPEEIQGFFFDQFHEPSSQIEIEFYNKTLNSFQIMQKMTRLQPHHLIIAIP